MVFVEGFLSLLKCEQISVEADDEHAPYLTNHVILSSKTSNGLAKPTSLKTL